MRANSKTTRRQFLKKTVQRALIASAGVRALGFDPASQRSPDTVRNVVNTHAILLDGNVVGWVSSVEGGQSIGRDKASSEAISKTQISGPKYADIRVDCGPAMSKDFYEWIKATLDGRNIRKNGAVLDYDYNYHEVSRRVWSSGLITEVGFPPLDAASRDAAYMTIKISPEFTEYQRGTGSISRPMDIQKKWLPANFRLQIAGCQTACQAVNKIGALAFRLARFVQPVEAARAYPEPRHLEMPNLAITLPTARAQELHAWYEDFVLKQNNGPANEKSGTLDYLLSDLKPLFTLAFAGLGILKFTPEKEQGTEIPRVNAEIYCRGIRFAYYTA
jgi:hypothetical protein